MSSASYDNDDPDFARLQEEFSQFKDRTQKTEPASIDFSFVNGGNWKTLCVLGGYTRPSEFMKNLGEISASDNKSLKTLSNAPFRLAEVEEHELMISYVDENNQVHFIHLPSSYHSGFQYFEKCVDRIIPVMRFSM